MILEAKVLFVLRQEREKEKGKRKRNDFLQTWFAGLRNLCYPGCIYKNNVHALTNSVGFVSKLGECRGFWEIFWVAFIQGVSISNSRELCFGLCRCTRLQSRMDWGGPVERKRKFYHRNCLFCFPLLSVLDTASWRKYSRINLEQILDSF